MALSDAYLVTTKNFEAVFNTLQTAKAPERFTNTFLENLGFKSSNDRLYIRLLKALDFLDDSGIPKQRYYDFLDQTQAGAILAQAVEEIYSDLFTLNREAHKMSSDEVKNKLRTLTQGKKSDEVIRQMTNTFVALSEYADWDGLQLLEQPQSTTNVVDESIVEGNAERREQATVQPRNRTKSQLHYNIQIHLPESRDPAVYDAIFQSLKKHLDV